MFRKACRDDMLKRVQTPQSLSKREIHRSNNRQKLNISPENSDRGSLDPRSRRVVVTGAGIISPLGHCIHNVFDKIVEGKSGIVHLTDKDYDYQKHGIYYAGQIPAESKELCEATCEKNDRLKSPAMKYAEFAAKMALENVWIQDQY